ncbi:Sec61p translocation complex subunit [Mortierella polycephala]|uniref:Sec61p translocation complex subunit n=1 Tax=Mortierella polycephala TaxID=41804 RepID=A0A9P6U5X5_9FUNG|nr:Sec61p translocation complex subunit [Mortierella polycephala]
MDNEFAQTAIEGPKQFIKDGVAFINRCTKPDRKEFLQITQAVSMGFFIMGVIGFVVKLIHIPINNILVCNYPPLFTSHGYQPSIFMDTSPKVQFPNACEGGRVQDPLTIVREERRVSANRVDYIQVWLNAHPTYPETVSTLPRVSGFECPQAMPSTASLHGTSPPGSPRAEAENDQDSDIMEWVSCAASPVSSPSLDCDRRPPSPSPALSQSMPLPVQEDAIESSTAPITFAFRQHAMYPQLPFRSRSKSIFLGSESSTNNRVNRRINDLLNNTAVQRIRSWFKTVVEPHALEQWRNLTLMEHLASRAASNNPSSSDSNYDLPTLAGTDTELSDCPICLKSGTKTIMKAIVGCGHTICWKCEKELERAGNVSCPMCRRVRLVTTYITLGDLFKSTVGLHPRDYTHALCLRSESAGLSMESDDEHVEHELSDRYLWEQSASFLEYLASTAHHPVNQYFQLNAAQDLCLKPSTEKYLPEYNDQAVLEPPMSGLVLLPHRLYITLTHFCLDMLTLPYPAEFQNQAQFKREWIMLELVILFLVPTDEFSPRKPDRIYNAPAWIEQGQVILRRVCKFLRAKVLQNMFELEEEGALEPVAPDQRRRRRMGVTASSAIPSSPVSRQILYLGTARWNWIVQSLTILVTWIQAANYNPCMDVTPANKSCPTLHSKQDLQLEDNPRPIKRQRFHRRLAVRNV